MQTDQALLTRFICKVRCFRRHFLAKYCCHRNEPRLLAPQFSRLFWGEQPPFASIGRGGRYSFGDMASPNDVPAPRRHRTGSTALPAVPLIVLPAALEDF